MVPLRHSGLMAVEAAALGFVLWVCFSPTMMTGRLDVGRSLPDWFHLTTAALGKMILLQPSQHARSADPSINSFELSNYLINLLGLYPGISIEFCCYSLYMLTFGISYPIFSACQCNLS